MPDNKVISLLLSAQRALLGIVTPVLRGVAVEWNGEDIIIYFYNDGQISEELEDDYMCVGSEIISDFTSGIIDEKIVRLDLPAPLPKHDLWAYRRKESF